MSTHTHRTTTHRHVSKHINTHTHTHTHTCCLRECINIRSFKDLILLVFSARVCAHTGAEHKSRMRTQCCRSRSRCMHTNSNTTHSRGVYDDTGVAKHQQLQAREGQRPPPRHLFCTNELPKNVGLRPNRCEIFCPPVEPLDLFVSLQVQYITQANLGR